ncbi:MAG TPA: hypothetical protein VGM81_00990 [Burkholderiaceae bacterium]|jgi:hypothetical protein
MTDLNEMHKWCVDARAVLGFLDKRSTKNLKGNSEAILALLTTMEKTPGVYPTLPALRAEYEQAAKSAQGKGEKELKKLAGTLHKLQIKLELAIGNADPNASPEARKRVVAEARHKPVYENKRKRIQAAIDELTPLPGTRKQVDKLNATLTAATDLEPDYEAAYKALEGRTKQLKEGREKAQTWSKAEFSDKLKKALTVLRTAISGFAGVAGVGDTTRVDAEEKWINDSLSALAGGSGDPKKADKAKLEKMVADCGTRATKLNEDAAKFKLAREAVEAYQKALDPLITSLKQVSPAEELGNYLARFNAAQSLAGAQQFDAAKKAFDLLNQPLIDTEAKRRGDQQAWAAIDTKLTEGLTALEQMQQGKTTLLPTMEAMVSQLISAIRSTLRGQLVPARKFTEAVAKAEELKVLDNITALKEQYALLKAGKPVTPAFKGDSANLTAQLRTLQVTIRTEQVATETAIKELEAKAGDGAPHRQALEVLMAAWHKANEPFTSDAETAKARLDKIDTLNTEAQRIVAAIKKLAVDVRALKDDDAQLKLSSKSREKSEQGTQFEAARKKAQAALDYLRDLGVPDTEAIMAQDPSLVSLRDGYAQLVTDAKAGTYAVGRMSKVETDAVNKRGFHDAALLERKARIMARVATLNTQMLVLRKATPEAYHDFLDDLEDELSGISGLATSKAAALMQDGETQLLAFETRFAQHQAANRDPAKESFAKVDVERARLKGLLEAKDLIAYDPTQQTQLLTQLTKVMPNELAKLAPAKALVRLQEHEALITAMRTKVDALKLRHAALKTAAGTKKTAIEAFKTSAPGLHRELSNRLAAIEGTRENDTANGELLLKSLTLLLTSAADPGKRDAMNAKAQADALQAQKDEANFKAQIDVFEKDTQRALDELKSEVGSKYNKPGYEAVGLRLDDAKKAGKAGNYSDAMDKLRLAQSAARHFQNTPYEATAAAGRALLAASGNWRRSVGDFLRAMTSLREAITTQCGQEVDPKAALTALEPLDTLFNPVTFDYAAGVLSEPPKGKGDSAERAKRRTEKEAILVIVTRYTRLLESNKLLQSVADNPFSEVRLGDLRLALKGVNAAFLAS